MLNHRLLTDPCVAHLRPLRMVEICYGSAAGAKAGTTAVSFLYEHLQGGWAVGLAQPEPDTGKLSLPNGSLQTSAFLRDIHELDTAPLLTRFDRRLQELREAPGVVAEIRTGASLPLELEQHIAAAMNPLHPPVAGELAQDCRTLESLLLSVTAGATKELVDALAFSNMQSPEADAMCQWLCDQAVAGVSGSLPENPLCSHDEARCWAYLLTEVARTRQDGMVDALGTLAQEGAEAFCAHLPDPSVATLSGLVERTFFKLNLLRRPRYTVADLVHHMLYPHARTLRLQWARASGSVPV